MQAITGCFGQELLNLRLAPGLPLARDVFRRRGRSPGFGDYGQMEKSRTLALTTGIAWAMGKILSAVLGTLTAALLLTARTQPR
jgi:hypothetical protein